MEKVLYILDRFLASCIHSTEVLLNNPISSKAEEASKQITVSKEQARKKAELYVKGVIKRGPDTKTGCGESLLHNLRVSYIYKYDLFF